MRDNDSINIQIETMDQNKIPSHDQVCSRGGGGVWL